MTVLVTAASKHGATAEIAQAIARELARNGVAAEYLPVHEVHAVERYAAVVLGSAVYAGHWLPAAKALVEHHAEELRQRPVWIFSSGPVGDPPRPKELPVDVVAMLSATGAREHRLFCGRLDRQLLGFAERAIARAVRAAEGDYRDWKVVQDWTASIAAALTFEAEALPDAVPGTRR
jgi:menaquinone-dependent protoporphyrinogen oxidase